MILVTGAGGKTGRAVVRALAARGRQVRALVRRADLGPSLNALGAQQVVVGDMRLQTDMDLAVEGVKAVYHICPNMSADEVAIGQIIIASARAAGVLHFVYHSVLHPQVEAMPHHWHKMRVEERLFESGLSVTILQPTAYMQNLLAHRESIVEDGIYPVPYAVDSPMSLVDLADVSQVAALVLTEPGHVGTTYELVGEEAATPSELASQIGRQLGREVRAQAVPLAEWQAGARASGLAEPQVETLLRMFQYYEAHGFAANSKILGWLLGRAPNSLEAFVKEAFGNP